LIQSGKESNSSGADELYISITTNSKERTFTLFDSGIGMDRDEIVDNLGTIAKSGSQAFVKNLNDTGVESNGVNDSIIGQFGVGFYSSFVVSNHVEVFSRKSGSEKGVRWVSDGCGTFEVSDVDNLDFERGTKIVLKLTPESREFSQETIVEKVCKKFS
jgi:HSP90 family molecular chaperone